MATHTSRALAANLCAVSMAIFCLPPATVEADDLWSRFVHPPASARPGVYWYFMDGNLSREGMTRDLESMKAAGIGHVLFLEVNVGVPRGPIDFLSEAWQDLYVHAVREAERLGIEVILGSGPGWTGSGGPWVKPEQSMQHLVAAKVEVQGPGRLGTVLPVPPPHPPYFGDVPARMRPLWEGYFKDVAVLAFPTPAAATIPDLDEKSLVYRAPFSSTPGVKPWLESLAHYPVGPAGGAIPLGKVIDLTGRMKPDGTLDWKIPNGKWTVMRFVARNNGAITRPAPEPGIGFECDKFDAAALDAHFDQYVGKLLAKVGPRKKDGGWTMLHIDSWEMGAQNWTPKWREEFKKRRGYDPQPFYPALAGCVVGSREQTERFLWDLRATGSELVIQNHAERLKTLGRQHGLSLSIEPYDMDPANDFDLGAVADVPMCEFWSVGFNTTYSCQQASSIAHIMGRPVVAAEAFTGAPGEDWRLYPGALKNQGDWAFATGINRFTYHTFAHKPDESRPGMVMGPYGVHWDRGQTWWPMAEAYHRYIARCQEVLRQGRTVADVLYLMPEGAPNVFQPPASAFAGDSRLPDRRGYNFDGCSANVLIKLAGVRDGNVVFPGGASYRMLVLPNFQTMTPELLGKLASLVKAGATVVGEPPRKSPSLANYPACDAEVAAKARLLWGSLSPPSKQSVRRYGKGRMIFGGRGLNTRPAAPELYPTYEQTAEILRTMGVAQDFESPDPVRYTHRSTEDREIYFVANRSDRPFRTTGTFRAPKGAPELWDPATGKIRSLPQVVRKGNLAVIPLRFEAYESFFVVFPKGPAAVLAQRSHSLANFADAATVATLEGPWDVSFDPAMGGPEQARFDSLQDWALRPEPTIRHYSGIATYKKTFDLPPSARDAQRTPIYLDLGNVQVMARVRVNGKDCGVAWTAPWRVDITDAVQGAGNKLEIEVANLWPNRMIGDAASPENALAQTTYKPYRATDPLLPSGLLGPVRVKTASPVVTRRLRKGRA